MSKLSFSNSQKGLFFSVLRQRTEAYFKENQLPKTGGTTHLIKAFTLLGLYFIPYFWLLFTQPSGWIAWIATFIMGLGIAGVGMCVMHDALHGSLSQHKWVNRLLGSSIYFLGGNAYNWEIQHNRLHHTYTNIHEVDEDITGKFLLRLSFNDKRKPIHRFQFIYAFFLYSLMTISFLWKDFKEIGYFNRLADQKILKPFPRKELLLLFASKIGYVLFIALVPALFTDYTLGEWLIGFFTMHLVAGLILSIIFQLAHIVEGADHPQPTEQGVIMNDWAIHQLQTTANFAGSGKWFSWFVGGLDYQVEHHLFPHISHVHYAKLSPIVAQTAQEFGLNYLAHQGIGHALKAHIEHLKSLGSRDSL